MGLANRVVPEADLETFVKGYADAIAGNAPLTIGSVKFIVGEALKDGAQRDNAAMAESVRRCFASKDYIEGRTAFMEKRKPVFTGS
jgi:enoyl-CoA hydratase/carnithine racemase